ncbi:MAG: DUF1223 domain-containing protein [Hydrogenophilales bacterium]|nr:DUF1223 domain-containing protein [Hydrogenophilales bacterium]
MNLQAAVLTTALLAASLPAGAGTSCEARSGPNTAALVELYTSEGCSSCPPADRQLSHLADSLDASAAAVPLALHVGYWDRLGWADRFAQDRFAERQAWLAQANRQRAVYTPEFFVAGAEIRSWRGSLRDVVRDVNARPALAAIQLHAAVSPANVLALDAAATAPADQDAAVLYLAVAENGLVTRVMAGENKDATLRHEHVVRAWLGPFPLTGGKVQVRREVALPAGWQRDRLEAVAFVQDERSGEVLQALRTATCPGA